MPTFVEGEGGEPLAPDGLSPASDTVPPPSSPDTDFSDAWDGGSDSSGGGGGGVTGAGSLSLEVTLLSIDATDKVADEIARRIAPVAERYGLKGVVIADPASIAMLRVHSALSGELGALETRITAIEAVAAQEPSAEGGFVDLAAAAALKVGTKSVAGIASNVGKALKVFAVSSAFSGKKDVVRPSALHAALAKHVAARGLEAQVPRYSVMAGSGSRFIDRLLDVQRRCRSLSDGGTVSEDLDSVNMVVSQLTQQLFDGGSGGDTMGGSSSGKLLQQLSEADMIANAIAGGFGLMTVELAASGGSYRARKWILNALFGRDGLTYSGGSAVTFFLLAGDRMAALASDTIYFASGHGSFGNRYNRFSPTNIAGLDSI